MAERPRPLQQMLSKAWRALNEQEVFVRPGVDIKTIGVTARKTSVTHARPLTEADYNAMHGVIPSLEKPDGQAFQPGDFLAQGDAGDQWPIQAAAMAEIKEPVPGSEPDAEGWRDYRARSTIQALEWPRPFRVTRENGEVLHGKAHDIIRIEQRQDGTITLAPIDKEIYKKTYTEEPSQ